VFDRSKCGPAVRLRNHSQRQFCAAVGEANLAHSDVSQAVHDHGMADPIRHLRIRLKCEDPSGRADTRCASECQHANIGPNVHEGLTGL